MPDVSAGCSLASSISAQDVRDLKKAISRSAGNGLHQYVCRNEKPNWTFAVLPEMQ
jgi:quinolinate synthase